MSRDVWLIGKGLSSIGSSCAEKTFKMCQNIGNHQNSQFLMFLGLFLGLHWSDWTQTILIESGILRDKFRVPTMGTLEHFKMPIFFTLTPLEPKTAFYIFNCHRAQNKTLSKNIFNKRGRNDTPYPSRWLKRKVLFWFSATVIIQFNILEEQT